MHSVDGPSGPGFVQHHWTSSQLHDGQSLWRVSFRCKNRGRLWLSLLPASSKRTHNVAKPKARHSLVTNVTGHRWKWHVWKVPLEDPLRRLSRAGDRYTLTFTTEIGGSTSLQVKQFTLHFQGELFKFLFAIVECCLDNLLTEYSQDPLA